MVSLQLKHFFISALKFAVCVTVIYLLVLFLLCTIKLNGKPLVFRACQGLVWKGGYTYERFEEFNPDHHYDVLIFGSSRANRGLNPRLFETYGYNTYNLGTDDQTPLNTEMLVRHYVKPKHCGLVIIDIYDKVFTQSDLESTSDLIQNLNENKAAFSMALVSKDIRALNFFCVRMLMLNKPPLYESETDLYKGFRELKQDSMRYPSHLHPYSSETKNIQSLNRILKYLHSINVPFLLVSQPMIFHTHEHKHDLFLKDVETVLKENGARLYDYTNYKDIVSQNDYVDECHLNIVGANKYSEFILKNLVVPKMKVLH